MACALKEGKANSPLGTHRRSNSALTLRAAAAITPGIFRGETVGVATAASVAFKDLAGSVIRMPLAMVLALRDVHGRYRRTVLGPFWITLAQAATVGGFALVFSGIFGMDPATYLLYLAAGFPIWTLISQYLTDMPSAFVASKGLIEAYELPWLTHIWRKSLGYLITFAHHIIILFVTMAVLGVMPTTAMLYAIPGLIIVLFAGTGVGMFLAVIGARYRDLQHAMVTFAGVLMLLSPVVWRAEQLTVNAWVVQFNPLHYFIKVLRDPLLGVVPSNELLFGTSIGAVALFVIGFLTFMLSRRRLYHWL